VSDAAQVWIARSTPPIICQSLTLHANGRMTSQEIRDHATTIATHAEKVFNQNPSLRPKY